MSSNDSHNFFEFNLTTVAALTCAVFTMTVMIINIVLLKKITKTTTNQNCANESLFNVAKTIELKLTDQVEIIS